MLSRFANPHRFMVLSKWLLPTFAVIGLIMLVSGWVWALYFVPEERYQGATARIMYIHVPAAVIGMMAYGVMALGSLLYLILKYFLFIFVLLKLGTLLLGLLGCRSLEPHSLFPFLAEGFELPLGGLRTL